MKFLEGSKSSYVNGVIEKEEEGKKKKSRKL